MKNRTPLLGGLLLLAWLLILPFAGGHPSAAMAQPVAPGWQPIQLDPREVAGSSQTTCFDPADNNVLLYVEARGQTTGGTIAFNWVTGQRTQINAGGFALCGANGWLYADYPPRRFSPHLPAVQPLAYMPTHLATDGSQQVYRFESQYKGNSQGHLWASADGGLTWQERAQEFKGALQGFAMTATDARSIYLLTDPLAGPGVPTVLFSSDAGATWEARGGVPASAQDTLGLEMVPSRTAPPDMLALLTTIHEPEGDALQYWVSINGGRAFRAVGTWDLEHHVRLLAPATGPLLRLDYMQRADDPQLFDHVLSRTTDGGYSWTPITVPFPPIGATNWYNEYLAVASGNTNEIFINVPDSGVWRSSDGGLTWAPISGAQGPFFYGTISEYWPPTLLGWAGPAGLYVWQPPVPPPGPTPIPPPGSPPPTSGGDTGIDLALTQHDHRANPVCFDARQTVRVAVQRGRAAGAGRHRRGRDLAGADPLAPGRAGHHRLQLGHRAAQPDQLARL